MYNVVKLLLEIISFSNCFRVYVVFWKYDRRDNRRYCTRRFTSPLIDSKRFLQGVTKYA